MKVNEAKAMRQRAIESISASSNTINIYQNTNIDHVTITAFMNLDEVCEHAYRLAERAEEFTSK